MGIIHQIHDLHVTGGNTLCWYYLYNCMLWDWDNNSWLWLSAWNIVLSYLSFEARCFRHGLFLLNLVLHVSAEFIFGLFLCMSEVHSEFDWRICSSLTVCSQFWYEFSTGIRYLKLLLGLEFLNGNLDGKLWSSTGTHISVEMVMFLQLPNFY